MSYENTNKTQNVRISLKKLNLKTKAPDGRDISLNWSLRNQYPRITVWLPDDPHVSKYDRMIILPFTPTALIALLATVEAIADGKTQEVTMNCLNMKWENNVKTDTKEIVGSVTIKKSQEGVVGLYIKSSKHPEIRFDITLDKDWFKMYENGSEITEAAKTSVLYSKAYAKTLQNIMEYLMTYDAINDKKME